MRKPPVAVTLFSGAGGLCEGLEAAGFRVSVASELHPQPALTLAFNHPDTQVIVGDIRHLSTDLIKAKLVKATGSERVDLIAGGPPCQGFSTAGKKSSADPRNDLFRQFARIVAHFRPQIVLLENVPGFKKMYDGRVFREASNLFSDLGYNLEDCLLTASSFGVPQRRQRFVMVGVLRGKLDRFEWPQPTHGEPTSFSLFPSDPLGLKSQVTVLDALEDIAFLEPGWEAHRHRSPCVSDFQVERRGELKLVFNHLATRHRARAVQMFEHIPEGGTISAVPKGLRSAKRTMARLDRHRVANAVIALPDDFIHYRHSRIPTVREMARLQTFDDDYVFFGKRTSGFVERRVDVPQYTQVGNAVPPILARAIGVALLRALGREIRDVREIERRRERHSWVCGSSGFAGYTLAPTASDDLSLWSQDGAVLPFPVFNSDPRVSDSDPLVHWVSRPNPVRGQWSPGVKPRPVPAHVSQEVPQSK